MCGLKKTKQNHKRKHNKNTTTAENQRTKKHSKNNQPETTTHPSQKEGKKRKRAFLLPLCHFKLFKLLMSWRKVVCSSATGS